MERAIHKGELRIYIAFVVLLGPIWGQLWSQAPSGSASADASV